MSVATADIREIVSLLREVKELLHDVDVSTSDFKAAAISINEVTRALHNYLSIARTTGMPPESEAFIRKALQVKAVAMSLYRSLLMLQAASGPWGLVSALISLTATGYMMSDLGSTIYDETRGL